VDQTEWPPGFEQVVSARLISPPTPGDLKPDLTRAGIDSLETIGLMIDLDDTFDVTISDDLLTGGHLRHAWHPLADPAPVLAIK